MSTINKYFQRINIVIIIIFVLLFSFASLYSQQKVDLKREILVYIKPTAMNFADSVKREVAIDEITFQSVKLKNSFHQFRVKSLKKAFPDSKDVDTIKIDAKGKIISIPQFSRIFRLKLKNKEDIDSAIAVISKIPGVLYAEKNMNAKISTVDPDYTKQWYLNNTGQSGGTIGADIKAELAWQIFTGSSSVIIGIMDSGIETTHDDLTGKATGDVDDGIRHGTHVAGIAAAKANNNHGGSGVDWNAQILSRQLFSTNYISYPNNPGGYMGDANTANKINDVVNSGANILNNSWSSDSYSTTVRMAFAYAYKMDRVSVAAMGNDYLFGNPTIYPAAFGQGIISVGATSDQDVRAGYSQTGTHIDVVAPGGINSFPNYNQHDIWSTVTGNSYDYIAGTSMATPVVSGIASLLKGYNPNLYNDDIEQIIQLSVDKVAGMSGQNYTNEYGYGRVNAKKALDFLRYPYVLSQLSASGGTDYFKGPAFYLDTYGASGLPDNRYIAYRHEVRKTVYFSSLTNPNVWGRGVATNGWSAENPNFGMGYCNVVPGTITSNSATLYTYVYEVSSIEGGFLGWYPTTPSGVQFAYTTLGTPAALSVSISGSTNIVSGQNGTWTAYPDGGYQPYTYNWYYRYPAALPKSSSVKKPPAGSWNLLELHSQQISRTDNQDFELKCVVIDNVNSSATSNIIYVYVTGGLSPALTSAPKENKLIQNYPNPFNPSTEIKYTIKKDGFVTIRVYDVLGRVVATLVNENKPEGFYTVNFDASKLSSGIYFYSLHTGNFVSTKKLILMK